MSDFYPYHNFVAILLYNTPSLSLPQKFHLFIAWYGIEQNIGVLTPYYNYFMICHWPCAQFQMPNAGSDKQLDLGPPG